MPLRKHPIFGRPMSEYLTNDHPYALFPPDRIPPSSYVKTVAIPQLENMLGAGPSAETCYHFSSILSLLRRPKELRYLENTTLLEQCIIALNFIDASNPEGEKLFSYEYGYLCFQAIVLLMHIGILACTNTFDTFLRQTRDLSDPQDVFTALAKFVQRLRTECTRPDSANWLYDLREGERGTRMMLKPVGGFYDTDVDFLLEVIWQDRVSFSRICSQGPTPGWGLPFLLLGQHLEWAVQNGLKPHSGWTILDALCYRYSLVAPVEELKSLSTVCIKACARKSQLAANKEVDDKDRRTLVADPEDARIILQAYLGRMVVPASTLFPRDFAGLLLGFIKQDAVLRIADLAPLLIKTTCSWIWEELDISTRDPRHASENPDLFQCASYTLDVISQLYIEHASTKTLSTLTAALAESDFVNLALRILLLPLGIGSNISSHLYRKFNTLGELSDREDPRYVARRWRIISRKILEFANAYRMSRNPSDTILHPFYNDWLKVRRCFHAEFPQHSTQFPLLQNHKMECYVSFFDLGSSLGYSREAVLQCAYPRCPGAVFEQLACEKCLDGRQVVIPYCSRLCQTKHWAATTGESHHNHCAMGQESPVQVKPT